MYFPDLLLKLVPGALPWSDELQPFGVEVEQGKKLLNLPLTKA